MLRPLWRSKPHRYLSHLLGHESEGSLLSLLKRKGWADALCAGDFHSSSDFALFEVQVDLTEEGMDHVKEIVTHVFQYIEITRPGFKCHGLVISYQLGMVMVSRCYFRLSF